MSIHYLNVSGIDITLLDFLADWTEGVRVQHRIASEVTTLESGQEIRRASAASMLLTQAFDILLTEDEAEELRIAHGDMQASDYIAAPLHPDAWPKAEYAAKRKYDPQFVVNFEEGSGVEVYPADSIPVNPPYKYLAPLLVGKLLTEIRFKAINENQAKARVTLAEDSPYAFRIEARDMDLGNDWPAELSPDWKSEITEIARNGFKRTQIGSLRERQTDGDERVNWWERAATFLLLEDEIATLLDFWSGKLGMVRSFLAPAWFTPGTPTQDAPHGFASRFDSDNLDVTYTKPNMASASLRLVVLPWEGVDSTPYQKPQTVRLFEFTYQTPTPYLWRFTDHETTLANAEGSWLPAPFELTSRNTRDLELSAKPFRLLSHSFTGNPLNLFHPYGPEAPIRIRVIEADLGDLDNGVTLRVGTVSDVMQKSRELETECEPFNGILDSPFPSFMIQHKCNWRLFSPQCGLSKATYKSSGTIDSIDGAEIVITTAAPESTGYFAGGFLEIADGLNYERRSIIASVKGTGTQTMTLNKPLRINTVGASLDFFPGCDKKGNTCRSKFSNFTNFSGFENIPEVSPSIKQPEYEGGGKK